MFTGIIEEIGIVEAINSNGLTIASSKLLTAIKPGCSISVNGVCLTAISTNERSFVVDVVPETLSRTNLGFLKIGDSVNLERPLLISGRLDGHIVQGHVDDTGIVKSISQDGEALLVNIHASSSLMRYIVEKGFIAVDGISLTVVNCDSDGFLITVVPFTMANTILQNRVTGDKVNLEVDLVAKYVESFLLRRNDLGN